MPLQIDRSLLARLVRCEIPEDRNFCPECGADREAVKMARTLLAEGAVLPDVPDVPEGFTPWAGGAEPPVAPDTRVDVVMRSEARCTYPARVFSWCNWGGPGDIVAYRVLGDDE